MSAIKCAQGRFSGRLETKQDEKRLAEECKLLGPLLGGSGKRGEKSRLTLAKIVRGIASGDVRKHCEAREAKIKVKDRKCVQLIAVLGCPRKRYGRSETLRALFAGSYNAFEDDRRRESCK
jgi:hypothetical protein